MAPLVHVDRVLKEVLSILEDEMPWRSANAAGLSRAPLVHDDRVLDEVLSILEDEIALAQRGRRRIRQRFGSNSILATDSPVADGKRCLPSVGVQMTLQLRCTVWAVFTENALPVARLPPSLDASQMLTW